MACPDLEMSHCQILPLDSVLGFSNQLEIFWSFNVVENLTIVYMKIYINCVAWSISISIDSWVLSII